MSSEAHLRGALEEKLAYFAYPKVSDSWSRSSSTIEKGPRDCGEGPETKVAPWLASLGQSSSSTVDSPLQGSQFLSSCLPLMHVTFHLDHLVVSYSGFWALFSFKLFPQIFFIFIHFY